MIEKYVGNKDPEVDRRMPAIKFAFEGVKKVLDENVELVYAQEAPLYSDHLMVAGRVDLVAKWAGRNAIVDFKTSNRFKKREDIVNYYLQETAYAIMFEERTGIPIVGLVTVIMVDDRPEPLIYKEHRDFWAPELISAIEEYRRLKLFGRK
jgi:genome maintenance exonuclease 1